MTQRDGFPLVETIAEHLMSVSAKRLHLAVTATEGSTR
jgi:hypothetical protein